MHLFPDVSREIRDIYRKEHATNISCVRCAQQQTEADTPTLKTPENGKAQAARLRSHILERKKTT